MKGQVDSVFLIVQGFAVIVVMVILYFAFSSIFNNPTAQQGLFNKTTQGQHIVASTQQTQNLLANSVVFIWVISGLAACIAAFFVGSSPIFVIPALVVLPIEGLLSFVFHDTFFIMMQTSAIGTIASSIPLVITFMTFYPFIAIGIAFAIMIVTYTKPH